VPVAAVAISSAVAGLAALLAPFGAAWLELAIMEPAILWILAVAGRVASWDGAVSHVVTPQPWILPVLVLGLLWLVLWKERGLAPAPAALALAVSPMAERPALLIADAGGLVGLLIEDGRGVEGAGADLAILAGCAEGPAPEADGSSTGARWRKAARWRPMLGRTVCGWSAWPLERGASGHPAAVGVSTCGLAPRDGPAP
jgi:competence protein ComEC